MDAVSPWWPSAALDPGVGPSRFSSRLTCLYRWWWPASAPSPRRDWHRNCRQPGATQSELSPKMATDSVYANSTHGTNLFTCTYVHSDTVRRCSESSMCGHVKFDNRYNLPYSVYTIHDMVHIFMICVYIRGCEYCTLSGMLLPECQAIMCVMHTCATYQSTASFRFPTESMQGARVCFT